MRALAIKLILFWGIVEGLQHVNLMVLLAGSAIALAGIVCLDYVFRSES